MWIARDKDLSLHAFPNFPVKMEEDGYWLSVGLSWVLPCELFPTIRWKDKKPRELILK